MTHNSSAKRTAYDPTSQTLPDHIIEEHILLRLDVKPLIRFKCVSKEWHSIISNQKFRKAHFDLWWLSDDEDEALIVQEPLNNPVDEDKFYLTFDEKYNLIDFVGLKNKYPPYKFDTSCNRVVGSCHGLLSMFNEQTMRMYIWNPVTNECRDTEGPVDVGMVNDYKMKCVGFGHVSSLDDYKIGCLMFYKNSLQIFVFSLNNGVWKKKVKSHHYYDFLRVHQGDDSEFIDGSKAVVDGTIYWTPRQLDHDRINYLIGLDLVQEDTMLVPVELNVREDQTVLKLFVKNERLAMCVIEKDDENWSECDVYLRINNKTRNNRFRWVKVLKLTYVGTNFLYLFENGVSLVSAITHRSRQLIVHELNEVSSQQEQGQEGEGEGEDGEQEEQEQAEEEEEEEEGAAAEDGEGEEEVVEEHVYEEADVGILIWRSVERGNLFRYFAGLAWGYSESLISPFGPNFVEEK